MDLKNMSHEWDLIIIGGGPGGYVAAMDAADEGLSVLLFEENNMGGVCLNEGCVPTKTMLHSAHQFESLSRGSVEGVSASSLTWNHKDMQSWKSKVVNRFRKGVESLMKGHKVQVLQEQAVFKSSHTIEAGGEEWTAKNIIIASGAQPLLPPIPGINLPHVISSREFLEMDTLPESLVVIGGGVIGLEIASLCASMGVEVHIVEMLDSLLGGKLPEIASVLQKELKSCNFHLGCRVEEITESGVICSQGEKKLEISAQSVLVSIGRIPRISQLNLKSAGVVTAAGGIAVNDRMQTSIPGVYAIGDVTGLTQYAHAASHMGEIAVANICGKSSWFEKDKIPWVLYTSPEAAGCGLDTASASAEGYDPVSAQFRMANTARYFAENGSAPGWVTLFADRESGQILGIQMLGNGSSEMIFGGAIMVQNELTIDDVVNTVFPHPSVSEAIRECALLVKKKINKAL